MIIGFILLLVILWFLSLSIETYSFFKKNGIKFNNIISYLLLPFLLLELHIKVIHLEKDKRSSLKILGSFFVNYRLALIFITELILENIALLEATGSSPILEQVTAEETGREPMINKLIDLMNLPITPKTFGKMIVA
ncbi:hypothetical protein ACWOA0_03190 [Ignavigranum ruoffiae]|uniref:Uncharacterized protein n=1 Tax=Ignavigranum ruoffiae TaxID=89093 RepID=A0A1H9GRK4_9LACT|nr:hypothetical protein [Ignavigranum ruoffiae]SEQ52638.1 hypothetical protein SAMN04488558_1171 [Ignavigranum ruoffiae]